MAKKTRIDRRGKIRSLVRKFPTGQKPHWSITKRAAVNRRRRIVDEISAFDIIQVSDSITPHLNKFIYDSLTTSDTAFIGSNLIIVNDQTITDDGGIVKNFESPANADSFSVSDSIGFLLGSAGSIFNAGTLNETAFGAIMADQEFYTDSLTASDAIALDVSKAVTETATITDSISLTFEVGSLLNAAPMGLSQFND